MHDQKRVTSFDVAKAAGASRSTVSRVLNGAPGSMISEATRLRILKVADELNYSPNVAAQQLRRGRSSSIGLVLPSMTHDLAGTHAFVQFLRGITTETDARRYNLMMCSRNAPVNAEQMLRTGQIDGIVIIHPPVDESQLEQLTCLNNRVVVMNQVPSDVPLNWVDIDNTGGARSAVSHLLSLGHRRIGFIQGRPGTIVSELRRQGYQEALADQSIDLDPSLLVTAAEPMLGPEGAAAMRQLMRLEDPPTAVFCYRDLLAIGAMTAIEDLGLRVGTDVAVAGFDDEPASAYQHVPLTSVRSNLEEKGRRAASRLLDLIEGVDTEIGHFMLPTHLVVRASSGSQIQTALI